MFKSKWTVEVIGESGENARVRTNNGAYLVGTTVRSETVVSCLQSGPVATMGLQLNVSLFIKE